MWIDTNIIAYECGKLEMGKEQEEQHMDLRLPHMPTSEGVIGSLQPFSDFKSGRRWTSWQVSNRYEKEFNLKLTCIFTPKMQSYPQIVLSKKSPEQSELIIFLHLPDMAAWEKEEIHYRQYRYLFGKKMISFKNWL